MIAVNNERWTGVSKQMTTNRIDLSRWAGRDVVLHHYSRTPSPGINKRLAKSASDRATVPARRARGSLKSLTVHHLFTFRPVSNHGGHTAKHLAKHLAKSKWYTQARTMLIMAHKEKRGELPPVLNTASKRENIISPCWPNICAKYLKLAEVDCCSVN